MKASMTLPANAKLDDLMAARDRGEFGVVCRQLEILLARKEAHLALKLFRSYVYRELPEKLTMSIACGEVLPPQLAGMLDSNGYATLEAANKATDSELKAISGMGTLFIAMIREAADCIENGIAPPYADDRSDLAPDWPAPAYVPEVPPIERVKTMNVKEALQLIIQSGDKAVAELDAEIAAKERELDELRKMRKMLTGSSQKRAARVPPEENLSSVNKILESQGPMRPSKLARLVGCHPSSISRLLSTGDLRKLPNGSVTLPDAA